IAGLTDSIIAALEISPDPWELRADDTFTDDPIAAFGVLEAKQHRSRGITLEIFMGLMKYYRQTYLDLMRIAFSTSGCYGEYLKWNDQNGRGVLYSRFIERIFDRIEIAFCAEWSRNETVNQGTEELPTANRQLANEKNKFLTIFESLPTAIFLLDDHDQIVHMNLAAARMLNPSVAAGGHYYSTPDEQTPFPWMTKELAHFRQYPEQNEVESLLDLPNGEKRQVLTRFCTMQDISFKFSGVVAILQDITERKTAERELKKAQELLIRQEKMAALGQLAAGVAHEINNPMGFVICNLATLKKYLDRLTGFITIQNKVLTQVDETLLEQVSNARKYLKIDYIIEDVEQLLEESLDGANRVRHVVKRLNHFSQLDQDDLALVNLNEILETSIQVAWNEIKHVATLNRELGDLPPLECHPQQMNQAFLNLLLNAAQALDDHGTITVRSWQEDSRVSVSVKDNGKGIPAELLPRLFEPFFTTKEVGQGTGLGLATSYGIVKSHGGEITVQSEPGKGSTFTVTLPLSQNQKE
ncbi:MAG: ATP-binding protein, partial [Desulfuromonadaceae bacterium]